MKLAKPRRKRMKFALVGLLAMAVLGGLLWQFQDLWLSYWVPESREGPPAALPATEPVAPQPPAPTPDTLLAPPDTDELTTLSAAPWDDPRFRQGVRLFNQARERHHALRGATVTVENLAAIGRDAVQAGRLFDLLKPDAPDGLSLDAYSARAYRLATDIRQQMDALATPRVPPPPPPDSPATGSYQTLPDYREGSRFFNQALAQFNQYKTNPGQTHLLSPIEELARKAAEKFEAVKRQVPEADHAEIDRLRHQCYGLISACRGVSLRDGERHNAPAAPPFKRSTTGPRRRPALPAYQPIPSSAD
ncbi:MAG: hypothetical protein PHI93_04665 [Kiritimatiellae bacterium]|nr:hypothetical protein [Kiritimatiellia bacterium]